MEKIWEILNTNTIRYRAFLLEKTNLKSDMYFFKKKYVNIYIFQLRCTPEVDRFNMEMYKVLQILVCRRPYYSQSNSHNNEEDARLFLRLFKSRPPVFAKQILVYGTLRCLSYVCEMFVKRS